MSVTPLAVTFGDVTEDAGAKIRKRRERLGMSVKALAELANVDRGVLTRIEKGESARTTSIRLIQRALTEVEHEMGMDAPSVVKPLGDEGMMEVVLEGNFGVRAVVKGPVRNKEELQEFVRNLIGDMRRDHPEG